MKFVIVALVVFIGLWLWLRAMRRPDDGASRPGSSPAPKDAPEAMVDCAHCGVHFPAVDALRGGDGAAYCSPAHRDAGPARR